MSLVEQAIARMRNQAAAAKPRTAEPASKPATPPNVGGQPPNLPVPPPHVPVPPPVNAKRMTIDMAALRAGGYLPEESEDRQFVDHYRRIKRPLVDKALSGQGAAGDPRIIMVTSSLPGDGKTFTSINLALSMALERDMSVLLVDCDVAKRHITEILGLKQESGLTDALLDESIDLESLVMQTNINGLAILPSGRRVDGTAELLSSNRMRQLINGLCVRNPRRVVLLDSAPLLITNEGRTLLKIAGQVVLVVRAGYTPRNALQDALALINEKQSGGLILNQFAAAADEEYYRYGPYGQDEKNDGNAKT
jgi:exopolysaccharide/PEP-CTERM locus tyrosine autokinase